MRYRIEKVQHPDYVNQLLPMLVDSDHCNLPEPSAALWTWELWLNFKYNTVYNRVLDLSVFYSFVDSEYPDFFTDAAKLKLLDARKVAALSSFLLINFKDGYESGVSVSPSTFNRRVDSIVLFLDFHYSRYISRLLDIDKADKHTTQLNRLLNRIRKLRYKRGDVQNSTESAKPLLPGQMDLIRLIIRPSSDEFTNPINPYRKSLQLRNAVLIELLYEVGGRVSEIVLLRANDDLRLTSNPTIVIQNDGLESKDQRERKDGASHKTLHRELPISNSLSNLILEYMEESRPQLRKRSKSGLTPYLFVSEHDGGPMTTDGVEYILKRLFSKVPEVDNTLHSHQFRVNRGIEYRKGVDEEHKGSNSSILKSGDMQDTLTAWGGWSSRSEMPRQYTKAHIQSVLRAYLEKEKG